MDQSTQKQNEMHMGHVTYSFEFLTGPKIKPRRIKPFIKICNTCIQ